MKRTPVHFAFVLVLGFASPAAFGQSPPAPSSSADAAIAARKAAFMGMPEATRKAAQDALVWLDPRLPGKRQSARRRNAVGA
jgi:hypothetical protein